MTRTLMTRMILSVALCASASAASAQPRPSTERLTCSQARAIVASHGAVILNTGPHTYDRYVRDQGFCGLAEVAETVWERTADVVQCPVGYRCRPAGEARDREGP
jgi:hypothetical protein